MTEKEFGRTLQKIAPLFGCQYIVIPDLIPRITADGAIIPAHKRPFDGILVAPNANIAIELKIDYRQLKPHQEKYLSEINEINGLAFVVRCIHGSDFHVKYRVDKIYQNGKYRKVFENRDLANLINFFKHIGEKNDKQSEGN